MANFILAEGHQAPYLVPPKPPTDQAQHMTIDPDVLNELAPHGQLRAAINIGNGLLAKQDAKTGALSGPSVALAKALASRINMPITLLTYQSAGKTFNDLDKDAWDIAFMAHEPKRAEKLNFSTPYFDIQGTYLTASDSLLQHVKDVDKPGTRIASVTNAAYDLYLTRTLEHAELIHTPTSAGIMELYRKEKPDVAAGLRPILEQITANDKSLKVLEGHFMTIKQSMVTPKPHKKAANFLDEFVREMIETGFIAKQFNPK
jgi:polar amino acid transport system substrate-binding protein